MQKFMCQEPITSLLKYADVLENTLLSLERLF